MPARKASRSASPPRRPKAKAAATPTPLAKTKAPGDAKAGERHAASPRPVAAPESPAAAARQRCLWAGSDPLYVSYHDQEWGVPVFDDRKLFEFLVLEGAQAGLSWITILRKRSAYVEAFAGFDPAKVARFDRRATARLLANPGIVRNKLKIASAIQNARAFLAVQEAFGSFSAYQWRFVDGKPLQNRFVGQRQVPPRSEISDAFSKDLRQRGFNFVGSTIMYAHMQAVGMVNDHLTTCFRHAEVRALVD